MLALLLALQSPAVDATALPQTPIAQIAPAETAQPITIAAEQPRPREHGGEIVVKGRKHEGVNDPLEELNVKSFEVTQKVDDAVTRPLAMAYKHGLPDPVRDGLRNFLRNLSEPVVFLHFMLQIKPGKASETAARFVINSTAGMGGLVDVAKRKPIYLPRRINGLAYTLGYYGVKPGPYLYVPLVGPTTVRDMIGVVADRMVLPFAVGFPFTELAFSAPVGAIATLDRRAEFDDDLEAMRQTIDPYVARRDYYLRQRQREIDELRGIKSDGSNPKAITVPKREPEIAGG